MKILIGIIFPVFIMSACSTAPKIHETASLAQGKEIEVVIDCTVINLNYSSNALEMPGVEFNRSYCEETAENIVTKFTSAEYTDRFLSVKAELLTGGNSNALTSDAYFLDQSGKEISVPVYFKGSSDRDGDLAAMFKEVDSAVWEILKSERHEGTFNAIEIASGTRYLGQQAYIDEISGLNFSKFPFIGVEPNKLVFMVSVQGLTVVGEEPDSLKSKRYAANAALGGLGLLLGTSVSFIGKKSSDYKATAVLIDSEGNVVWNYLGGVNGTDKASDLVEDLIPD